MVYSLETLYTDVEMNLKIVQTAAVLEIIHAAIGFVKSPVMTTFMQGTPPSPALSLSGHRATRHQVAFLVLSHLLSMLVRSVFACVDPVGRDAHLAHVADVAVLHLGVHVVVARRSASLRLLRV